jgi:hypothetical protein
MDAHQSDIVEFVLSGSGINASSLYTTRTTKCRVCFESGQSLWSAPAERSGDGALGRAGIAGSGGPPDGIYDRAVSRFACHRTP